MTGWRSRLLVAALLCTAPSHAAESGVPGGSGLAERFRREVDMRLELPAGERALYAGRLEQALAGAGLAGLQPQYFLLVDRSRAVQALFIYWRSAADEWSYIGASPVSTGLPGTYDHFITPTGVFEHTPANMDFRAEGTYNDLGILGYGRAGMRVYDFGWTMAERGWGHGGHSIMRLQMHATDPDLLEGLLGRAHSKGCIRIPATLNAFLDHHGLIDAEYERAAAEGRPLWVLRPGREPAPWAGRYLVIVDSGAKTRPSWSPLPAARDAARARPRPATGRAPAREPDLPVC